MEFRGRMVSHVKAFFSTSLGNTLFLDSHCWLSYILGLVTGDVFDGGFISIIGGLGELWDFPVPRKFGLPYIVRQWGYIVWPAMAYIEAILDQNVFDDVSDIILYPYIVLSGLS